ncbi:MAG TPA: hypothetical protein VKY27_11330 [Bacteriovoracaceae bacterium]|nr:hypothetical protein [Bacteriovoracaceae bacterium]
MGKEKLKIQVLEQNSGSILQEFDLDQMDQAYALAFSLEEMGLDIQILNPTLSDTLSHSLGLSEEEIQAYKDSLIEEIEEHEGDYGGSCCFKK